jgi:hypothetical protein
MFILDIHIIRRSFWRFAIRPPTVNAIVSIAARVPGYRSGGPGSIPGATRFSEK